MAWYHEAVILLLLFAMQTALSGTAQAQLGSEDCAVLPAGVPALSDGSALSNPHVAAAEAFLSANPQIKDAIGPMSQEERARFHHALSSLSTAGRLPAFVLPTPVTEDDLRAVHVRRAASVVWRELSGKLPWSITAYTREQLDVLVGFTPLKRREPGFLKMLADMDSAFTRTDWLKSTREATIVAMMDWVRKNVAHQLNGAEPPNNMKSALAGGKWGTCHNVGDFIAVASTALNIPAATDQSHDGRFDHRYIDFPADRLFIPHGDDPYSQNFARAPTGSLLVRGADRDTLLKAIKTNPIEGTKQKYFTAIRLMTQPPLDEKLALAACGSERAVSRYFYAAFSCRRACVSLVDYKSDADRLIRDLYPAIKQRAMRAGACIPPGRKYQREIGLAMRKALPDGALLNDACRGKPAVTKYFYDKYRCEEGCGSLDDFRRDTAKLIDRLYPSLHKKATRFVSGCARKRID